MTGSSDPRPQEIPVEVRGSRGVQVGDRNIQYNIFIGQYVQQQIVSNAQPASMVWPIWVGDVPQEPQAFQRREKLMAALRRQGPGVPVVRVITGMRGVGKTQLAAAYARSRMADGWRLVAWVNAEDTARVLNGLGKVAARLGLSQPEEDLDSAAASVRHWLEADGGHCLLIFDNAIDVNGLRQFVPTTGQAQVIITSSIRASSDLGQAIPVELFGEGEAVAFLAERTGLTDANGALELAAELGYLPLALSQAAAMIARQRLGYATYLDRLRKLPASRHMARTEGDLHGVAAAVLLSMDSAKARESSRLGGAVLDLVTVLSTGGVNRALLYAAAADGALAGPIEDVEVPAAVDAALAQLADASLLSFSLDGSRVIAHRLIMRTVRELRAQEGSLARTGAAAAKVLRAASDSLERVWQNPAAGEDLIQQILALHEHLTPCLRENDAALVADLLALRAWAVWCMVEFGDSPVRAIKYGEPLVADRERILGTNHPDTLRSRNNLALAYWQAGRLGEAIPLFERTLADSERVISPHNPDAPEILTMRNNLAGAYWSAGRLGAAIPLHERTLADQERVLGADDPGTIVSRNNLAAAYHSAGQLSEAIPLFERTLADSERVLGRDHPKSMASRNNLAATYESVGRLSEAIPLLQRTLADRERVLGAEHRDTLASRSNLAVAYCSAGRLGEAILLLERILADRERVLGLDDPDTLVSRDQVASGYEAAGRLDEAIPLFGRTLADRERILGTDHPDTLASRNNLAGVYQSAGRLGEAIPLYERTLADRERILGTDHPDTLASRNNLALAYKAAGRLGEAIPLYERTLADFERGLGRDHPNTRTVRENLATAQQHEATRARGWFQSIRSHTKRHLRPR